MKRFAICICLLLIPVVCSAKSQISATKTITKIEVYEYAVNVFYTPIQAHNEACQYPDLVRIDLNSNGGRHLYNAVLSAYHAGSKVGFGINGCTSNMPKVYRVNLER